MELAQYCGGALANLWPPCRTAANLLFTHAECASLLTSLFEASESHVQTHIISTLLRLDLPAPMLAPLLDELLRVNMALSFSATLTAKAIGGKIEGSELERFHRVWRRFFQVGCFEGSFPGCLFPPLTDLLIAVEDYNMACRIATATFHSGVTPSQEESVKRSCALSAKLIKYAACNLFTDLALEVSWHALKTKMDILPILRAWNGVTACPEMAPPKEDIGAMSLLPDSNSLLSLLVMISRDDRCLRSDAECFCRRVVSDSHSFYHLLLKFDPKIVTYARLYHGPYDLSSDLLDRVKHHHDQLREKLPKFAKQCSEFTLSKMERGKTSNKNNPTTAQKPKTNKVKSKPEFFRGGFLLSESNGKDKEKDGMGGKAINNESPLRGTVQVPSGKNQFSSMEGHPFVASTMNASAPIGASSLDVTTVDPHNSNENGSKKKNKKRNNKNKRKKKKK